MQRVGGLLEMSWKLRCPDLEWLRVAYETTFHMNEECLPFKM